jgi:hypothetical protein
MGVVEPCETTWLGTVPQPRVATNHEVVDMVRVPNE